MRLEVKLDLEAKVRDETKPSKHTFGPSSYLISGDRTIVGSSSCVSYIREAGNRFPRTNIPVRRTLIRNGNTLSIH